MSSHVDTQLKLSRIIDSQSERKAVISGISFATCLWLLSWFIPKEDFVPMLWGLVGLAGFIYIAAAWVASIPVCWWLSTSLAVSLFFFALTTPISALALAGLFGVHTLWGVYAATWRKVQADLNADLQLGWISFHFSALLLLPPLATAT